MTPKRKLTAFEAEAVAWAKGSYCHWRKRFNKTLAEHMAERPAGLSLDYPWEYWYDHPFGWPPWNIYVQTLHRLFQEGIL